jgi:hypothetical protein
VHVFANFSPIQVEFRVSKTPLNIRAGLKLTTNPPGPAPPPSKTACDINTLALLTVSQRTYAILNKARKTAPAARKAGKQR